MKDLCSGGPGTGQYAEEIGQSGPVTAFYLEGPQNTYKIPLILMSTIKF